MSDAEKTQITVTRFNQSIKDRGIALSNFYGVNIKFEPRRKLDEYIKNQVGNWNLRLNYMCDEVNIPGMELSTGEYRINGFPQSRYVYGNSYNDMNMTFLVDGGSLQKTILDAWLNFIYPMKETDRRIKCRIEYPNEYCKDIDIIKFERFGNGNNDENNKKKSLPVYSVTLIDAFPKTISSLPLSSSSSQILRMSVTFEYRYHIVSTLKTLKTI